MKTRFVVMLMASVVMFSIAGCGDRENVPQPMVDEVQVSDDAGEIEDDEEAEYTREELDEMFRDEMNGSNEDFGSSESNDDIAKRLLDSIDRDDMSYVSGTCNMDMQLESEGESFVMTTSIDIEADKEYSHSFMNMSFSSVTSDAEPLEDSSNVEVWVRVADGQCYAREVGTTEWRSGDADISVDTSMQSFHFNDDAIAEYGMKQETDDQYIVYLITNPGYLNTVVTQGEDYGNSNCEVLYYFDKDTEILNMVSMTVNVDDSVMPYYTIDKYVIEFIYDELVFGDTDKTLTPPVDLF